MAEHASQAIIGWGSILYRGDSETPENFVQVTEVTAFTPPQEKADEVEVTHFESPNRRKEYIAGLIDAGEASCTINYNPAVYEIHDTLVKDFEAGDKHNYRFTLPQTTLTSPDAPMETIDFNAYISGFKRNLSPSGALTADVTFRVSTVTTERPAFT
jgi:hypothetical protein